MIGDKDIETTFEKQLARIVDGSTEKISLRFPSRILIQGPQFASTAGLSSAR